MHAYIKHRSPGRLRLRIPEARCRPDMLRRISDHARRMPGVTSTQFNPTTGSVLISSAEDTIIDAAKLAEALSGPDLPMKVVDMVAEAIAPIPPGTRSETSETLTNLLQEADVFVRTATRNKLDLRLLLPLGAGVGALGYLSKAGSSTPLWVTLAIFAVTSFTTLQNLPSQLGDAQTQSSPAYLH
jgi:hypothetical protein